MPEKLLRLLIVGAHPDDAEYHAGGLASIYRLKGHQVKMISVTNGAMGHHKRSPEELATIRRAEAKAAGETIGARYEVWDYPDGELQPNLELRRRIIREIRGFKPDLVVTHRTNDYHPDHRAVGLAVQDASYMVTVGNVCPDLPPLYSDPVVAYMTDLFTRPSPLRPDVVLDVTTQVDTIVSMLACHRSQVFEWLPYEEGILESVPEEEYAKAGWLKSWYQRHVEPRADRFRDSLVKEFGPMNGQQIKFAEIYEISEYASALSNEQKNRLFPPSSLICDDSQRNAMKMPSDRSMTTV